MAYSNSQNLNYCEDPYSPEDVRNSGKAYGFDVLRFYPPDGLKVDMDFENLFAFIKYLLHNGIKQGYYFFKIGNNIYDIYLPKNIDPVFKNNGEISK